MADFKGFSDWIEIFKGGKQTDSNGKVHDGDAIIDKVVNSFNAERHEPPLVIGHPKENDPAFGWVEGLKSIVKDGEKFLLMKAKNVVSEFEEMVKQGLFKKRSISVYPDGSLRHVGFLGAAPPAVKGLADLKFSDGEAVTFDFYDPQMGSVARILRNLRDWFIEKEGKEKADSIISDWDVEYIKGEANKHETETGAEPGFTDKEDGKMNFREKIKGLFTSLGVDMSKVPDDAIPDSAPAGAAATFSEADLTAAVEKAKQDERKKVDAEFTEKQRQNAKKVRDKEIADFVGQLVKEGKFPPSEVSAGVVAFAQSLDGDEVIQFAEGDGGKKSKWQFYKEQLSRFSESPIFKEMAIKDAAGDSAEFAESKKQQDLGESIAAKVNREG
ncbi:MAG: hypothetical protein PHG61_00770 [Candidatus Marinimicrobia bacterium]|nr:hypothetical protein [Candidatus Neomarinimicrobiota bacterium]